MGDLTCRFAAHSSRLQSALAVTSVTVFATSAFGQSPADAAKQHGSRFGTQAGRCRGPGSGPKANNLQSEIEAVKTENAEIRELFRKMVEQQKILLDQVNRLQQRLDEGAATDVAIAGQPNVPSTAADTSVPAANAALKPHQR